MSTRRLQQACVQWLSMITRERAMTRSPSTRTTSSEALRLWTSRGGRGSAAAGSDCSLPHTWSSCSERPLWAWLSPSVSLSLSLAVLPVMQHHTLIQAVSAPF
ncbi:UNVERIFIED_CONTAM: hypothetical protein FKN15_059767 [Acipenser sinensis]